MLHWFTTAYFHRPDELADELREAGFTDVDLVAVQGCAGIIDVSRQWDDPAGRELSSTTSGASSASRPSWAARGT